MAIACSCHGVRDHAVRDAAAAGATTVDEVAVATLAGASCGGCHPTLQALLSAEGALDAALGPVPSTAPAA